MEEIIIINNDEYQDIILQGIKKFNYEQRPKLEYIYLHLIFRQKDFMKNKDLN